MASVIMPHSPRPRHGLLLWWCGNGSHSCQLFWQSLEYKSPNHLQIYRWMFNEYLKMDHITTSRFRVLTETLKLFSEERTLSEKDFELDPLDSQQLPNYQHFNPSLNWVISLSSRAKCQMVWWKEGLCLGFCYILKSVWWLVMSGNGRKLPNTAYRFTLRLPEFSNHEHNEEMDKRKPGDLAWTGSNPPENHNLKYPHFRIKGLVWKENDHSKTNKSRFWQKSVTFKEGQWSVYNNFCPALYSKIIFQLFPLFTSNQFT